MAEMGKIVSMDSFLSVASEEPGRQVENVVISGKN